MYIEEPGISSQAITKLILWWFLRDSSVNFLQLVRCVMKVFYLAAFISHLRSRVRLIWCVYRSTIITYNWLFMHFILSAHFRKPKRVTHCSLRVEETILQFVYVIYEGLDFHTFAMTEVLFLFVILYSWHSLRFSYYIHTI